MNSEARASLIGLMWILMTGLSIVILSNSEVLGDATIPMTIFPIVLALLIMIALWFGDNNKTDEKAKREVDSLSVLMQLMDDDEREEFKEMLKQRALDNMQDGELPLDAALWESDYRERRN